MEADNYIRCKKCKQLFLDCDDKTCPFCGKLIEGAEGASKGKAPLIAKHINGSRLVTLTVVVLITILVSVISIVLNVQVYNENSEVYNSEVFQYNQFCVNSGLVTDPEIVDAVRTAENAYNTSVVLVWMFVITNAASIIVGLLMLIRFRWAFKAGIIAVGLTFLAQIIEAICCFAFGLGFNLIGLLATAIPKLVLILIYVIYNEKANTLPKPIEPIREDYD